MSFYMCREEDRMPDNCGYEDPGQRFAPGYLAHEQSCNVGKQNESQPFQDSLVEIVAHENDRDDRHHGKCHGVKRRRAADKKLEGFAHGAQIGADIDGVGEEEQNCDRIEQPRRLCFAQIASQTVAGRSGR